MAELSSHIIQVNAKVQQLIAEYNKLLAENKQQKKQLESLTNKDILQKEELQKLKNEHLLLKASVDKMDEAEKKMLDKKINGYIQNIDKCISLLSHK